MTQAGPGETKEFRNDVLRVADLTIHSATLTGYTFVNCQIIGPAVLFPRGETTIVHCNMGASADHLFWPISPERTGIVGAIMVVDCTFSACSFFGIGIAGPEELRAKLEAGITDRE